MLVALAPIILGLIGGGALPAVLTGVTVPEWLAIGDAVLSAAPQEIQFVRGLHSVLDHVIGQVLSSKDGSLAPVSARAWFSANADAAMKMNPGIGYDT